MYIYTHTYIHVTDNGVQVKNQEVWLIFVKTALAILLRNCATAPKKILITIVGVQVYTCTFSRMKPEDFLLFCPFHYVYLPLKGHLPE